MNSCTLSVELVSTPEKQYLPDGKELVKFLVRFEDRKQNQSTLKVTGWGNLAKQIVGEYSVGDPLIISGSLRMHTIDRKEGFKEKRAELTLSKICRG